ncbi:TPA: ASCH domain-containing protein [Streptococcus suis]|uniref:ASCH domain-containing protein n=1 Tax=Streptococcus suis TaxID=1307 RepID=UPI00192DD37C|nr:ASCH domain-containing protein [Streptococcus suis]MBL6440248.1 ASCH domain-containing protein [Streptococcus suis]MCO8185294.1 ASCH domain-containing protein [Streptococcus suis]MCO8216862.1 ASCH domain-containing protein [Streptococcus suis]HEM3497435.1 ASCH domain-containing protein [Streptococcus suis]HEM3510547.1 ASCH domain-containing protein [Streptococcus suis]
MKALLSIKPEFVEEIIEGKKRFEYRKKVFKRTDITSIVIYATKPYGKVVGEFEIAEIIEENLDVLWDKTKNFSGISEEFFYDYFKNRESGFAIKIKEFVEYEEHLELSEFDSSIKVAPQSFCYIGRY